MQNDETLPASPPPKNRRRWIGYAVLGLILVAGLMVILTAWRVSATPDYWQDHRAFVAQTSPQDIEHLAHDTQSRTLREWSYPIGEGDGVRTVRYNFDEVNAWLATRLRPLLENQNIELPSEVGEFIFTQRDGDLVLAFDYVSARFGPRIASLFFEFDAGEDRQVIGRIKSARAGNQRLVIRYLVQPLADQPSMNAPEIQTLLEKIIHKQWIDLPPIPVDDHRNATLLEIDIFPEGVELLIRVAYHNRD